jgi:hypothetical protein
VVRHIYDAKAKTTIKKKREKKTAAIKRSQNVWLLLRIAHKVRQTPFSSTFQVRFKQFSSWSKNKKKREKKTAAIKRSQNVWLLCTVQTKKKGKGKEKQLTRP